MSLLAELADRLHFSIVCKRAAKQVRRRIAATPQKPKRTGVGEPQQLAGKVADPAWVTAPLTGARVVGYRLLIETVGRYWMNRQVLVDHCVLADFVLEAEQGGHFVRGAHGRLIASEACFDGRRVGGSVEQPKAFPELVLAVLADRAQFRPESSDPRHYRWHEYHLHEGDEVFADGVGAEMEGATSDAGLCLAGSAERPLVVSRVPRARLLEDLSDPDEALMRVLPRFGELSDREP